MNGAKLPNPLHVFMARMVDNSTSYFFINRIYVERYETLTELLVNIQVHWDVTPGNLVHKYRRFWGKLLFPFLRNSGREESFDTDGRKLSVNLGNHEINQQDAMSQRDGCGTKYLFIDANM
jgi:hypothetical protein